jgi:ABC-2 type transport system permease protein
LSCKDFGTLTTVASVDFTVGRQEIFGFLGPNGAGIIGMSVLFTSMFSAISIIWDREFGFLKEVLVSPAPRWAVAFGKILGAAIAASMRSMQGFQMLMNFLVMPMYFLSGAMFPAATAPGWMRPLMMVDPLTYGVAALRGVVWSDVGVDPESAGLSLAENVGILGVCAIVLATVAAVRFGRAD